MIIIKFDTWFKKPEIKQ